MIESNAGCITSPRCVDGSSTGFVDWPAAVGCWFWHIYGPGPWGAESAGALWINLTHLTGPAFLAGLAAGPTT